MLNKKILLKYWPGLGRRIDSSGDTVVYALGKHRVLRVCKGTDKHYSRDFTNKEDVDLALRLKKRPVKYGPKIYSAKYVLGHSCIEMARYTDIGTVHRDTRYTIRKSNEKLFWDTHTYNVGLDRYNNPVCFDVWKGIGD